ncbi:MAG TPA: diguanylate cyclase [Thermoanaerobaculia bacterium]|jgi:diguanylate cyclase (GGDEF)-like protein|nr:diguanylate cyclase [Thermoanaerobaculia bacterium]
MSARPLRLLLVEDSERDAAQVMLSLKRGGWDPDMLRVETREEMESALHDRAWDVIVSDYYLPRFSAPDALATLRQTGLDIPFIVVTGVIGEDTAVRLMRGGASDYLIKTRMGRLNAALEREILQANERRAKRRAESLFEAVLRASPHPAALIDRETKLVVDASRSLRELSDATPFQRDSRLTDLIAFSLPDRIDQLVVRGSGTALHMVYYAGGIGRVANVRAYTVEHEGDSYAYVVIEDVTEQNYLKAAFDAIPDAVLVIGADQRLLYANRAAEELLGQLFFGMDVTPLLVRPTLEKQWWLRRTTRFDEQRIVVSGQPYAAASVVFRFAGEPNASTILTLRNVAEEEELQRLARHDALTGAWNVRHLTEVFDTYRDAGGVLALIDLDHFKKINDERGHAAGDAALITFANLVRNELRDVDLFARLGGDEFAVLFPSVDTANATRVLDGMYTRLARTSINVSCGVTSFDARDTLESAKGRADGALYEAKRLGRGQWLLAARDS